MADQTQDIVQKAKDGYLFLILYTAKGGRGHRTRLRVSEPKPSSADIEH